MKKLIGLVIVAVFISCSVGVCGELDKPVVEPVVEEVE